MTTPMIESEQDAAEIQEFLDSVKAYQTIASDRAGNFKGMLYGNDGTGKTISGLALLNYIVPADKKILLIDTAENSLSLNNHPTLKDRVVRLPYMGSSWLHALIKTIKNRIPPWDSIGGIQFDEYSNIADQMLAKILEKVEADNPSRPKDDATWPEYKMLLRQMRNLQNALNGLEGVHTTFVTHYRTDKGAFGKVSIAPNFTPSVGPEIRRPMHLVTFVFLDDEGNRIFQLQPDTEHLAKCKIGGLPRSARIEQLLPKAKEWLNGNVETVETVEVAEPQSSNKTDDPTDEWSDV